MCRVGPWSENSTGVRLDILLVLPYSLHFRVLAMANFFTAAIRASSMTLWQPFYFYLDATDGTRVVPELFMALGLPVLSMARGVHDSWTLPVPDVHQALGAMRSAGLEHAIPEAAMQLADSE